MKGHISIPEGTTVQEAMVIATATYGKETVVAQGQEIVDKFVDVITQNKPFDEFLDFVEPYDPMIQYLANEFVNRKVIPGLIDMLADNLSMN